MSFNWYAVKTRPRWEKKVADRLSGKGIENYCPLQKKISQWSDRKKVINEPIFKGYVFLKVSDDAKWDIKSIDGILNYVYWLGKPAVIKEDDIFTIRKFLMEFSEVEVEQIPGAINEKVRIKQGVLMNYEGLVVEISNSKAKVKIESMNLYLTARFDISNLAVVKNN